jgi:hypothetical protein
MKLDHRKFSRINDKRLHYIEKVPRTWSWKRFIYKRKTTARIRCALTYITICILSIEVNSFSDFITYLIRKLHIRMRIRCDDLGEPRQHLCEFSQTSYFHSENCNEMLRICLIFHKILELILRLISSHLMLLISPCDNQRIFPKWNVKTFRPSVSIKNPLLKTY